MNFRRKLATALQPYFGSRSYSASGEDRLALSWLTVAYGRKPDEITYLDVGANHPRTLSNTFAFYELGGSGVLVEPDPALCKELSRSRPRDTILNVGAAFDERRTAVLTRFSNPVFNTFSATQTETVLRSSANWQTGQRQNISGQVEIPLIPINDILATHFRNGIDFLSIDAEGVDLPILRSIDLSTHRPKIICIEASDDFEPILSPAGYEMIARTPDNILYRTY
jgi:FkbM family methyltransferase